MCRGAKFCASAFFWPSLHRLHVNGNVGLFAIAFTDALFDGSSTVMGNRERQVTVHAHVGLNGKAVADATCTQVMRLTHVGE